MSNNTNVVVDMLSEQGKKLDTLVSSIGSLVDILTAKAVSPVAAKPTVAKATSKKSVASKEAKPNDFMKAKKAEFTGKLADRIAKNPNCPQGVALQVVANLKTYGLKPDNTLVLAFSKNRTRDNARALIKSVGFAYDYDRKGFYKN